MSLKDSTTTTPKLNDYSPETANVKVSLGAMVKRLEALEAQAGDPDKVKEWVADTFGELQGCAIVG